MNKILLVLAMTASFFVSDAPKEDYFAKVRKVNGVEVYIMAEPLRKYETVVDVATGAKAESLLTGGLVNKSISGRIEQFIKRAKKENENFDAIIYSAGKSITSVRFTESGNSKTIGIAKVNIMRGMPIFVMSEPIKDYEVLRSEGGGIKWKSALTAGIVNNSIEEDIEKIVNKLDGVKNVQGFYLDGSKEGQAIKFTK